MSSAHDQQCKARTESGERCSRRARENGYCYQHDPEDETVDETVDENKPDETSTTQERTAMSEENNNSTDIDEVREQVNHTAEDIVGHPLDGITSINHDEENWRVAVEVIERKGVPDTQDILGRYEMILDENLTVNSYERTHRFRRDDMEHNV